MLRLTLVKRYALGVQADVPEATAAGVMSQPLGSAPGPAPMVPVSPVTVIVMMAPRLGGLLVAEATVTLLAAAWVVPVTAVKLKLVLQSSVAPVSEGLRS